MQGFKVPPWRKIQCSCSSVIYNLEVFTYNQTKPFIEILTRGPVILALFLNFARPPLIAREMQGIGSRREVMSSNQLKPKQTQINKST